MTYALLETNQVLFFKVSFLTLTAQELLGHQLAHMALNHVSNLTICQCAFLRVDEGLLDGVGHR